MPLRVSEKGADVKDVGLKFGEWVPWRACCRSNGGSLGHPDEKKRCHSLQEEIVLWMVGLQSFFEVSCHGVAG